MSALQEQLAYLEASSPFYARAAARRARAGAERGRPAAAPVHHQGRAARGPAARAAVRPAPVRAARAPRAHARDVGHHRRAGGGRLHASATTRPTARWAARRSGSPACARTTSIAHCLNYALYAGGIADHMALEASGATVVPVGTGQSRRLLELIPRLGITAIFGTLSFPAYLAARAREARRRAARARASATSSPRASRAPGSRRCASEIEAAWGATRRRQLRDERRLVDDGRRVRGGRGRAPDRRRPRRARAGRPGQRRRRSRSRTARAASSSGRTCGARPRRCCATAPATSARVWTSPCACGRSTPRIRIDGRRDDMLRVQAVNVYPQAIGAILADESGAGPPLRGRRGRPDRPAAARVRGGARGR